MSKSITEQHKKP